MAGSLDELMQFLLDEIAFSGQQGSTPADVLDFVARFYTPTNKDAASLGSDSGQAPNFDNPAVDRAFQEQVWRWLTKHPDVHVGSDREGNKMSLSAVEAQYQTKKIKATPEAAQQMSSPSMALEPNVQQHATISDGSRPQAPKVANALRVCVTEGRMWLALCGHPKDVTKVFDTEFALLCIIAAHRERGILQSDLVKESGQDKRSVPKRTDELRNKGYIEKRAVHRKGLRTSRLVFRKFADKVANDLTTPILANGDSNEDAYDVSIDFTVLTRSLFSILKEKQIVTREDLKKQLEMMTRWRARVLTRVIRRFEVIGCLKRVKAASEVSKKVRYYYDCVKLIHEPSDRDLEAFNVSGTSSVGVDVIGAPGLEDEEDADQAMAEDRTGVDSSQLEEVDRVIPQWNPDRTLANALLDNVHDAGMQGFTNKVGHPWKMPSTTLIWYQELRQHTVGAFVRRPLEHLLTRLTAQWVQSQPRHLRHLAIVRDTILSGTTPLYVQYSFPNFEARVGSGQAFWEAVTTRTSISETKKKKKSSNNTDATSPGLELDRFGFPTNYNPSSQYKGARATLGQSLLAAHPEDLPLSNRDPILYHDGHANQRVRYDAAEARVSLMRPARQEVSIGQPTSALPHASNTTKAFSQTRQRSGKRVGRPRKFLQGTENFWQGQFAMARKLANSDKDSSVNTNAGVMTDPAGLTLFAKRPPQFDYTLVHALESGLPVPSEPKDITQEWVDKMTPILDRSIAGVYLTPKGVRLQGPAKHRGASRVLILRSSRLIEINLSKRKEVPAVRFFTSSVAHTFAHLRDQFLGETIADSDDDICASPSSCIRPQSAVRDSQPVVSEGQEALHDSVTHTSFDPEYHWRPVEPEADINALSTGKARGIKPRKNARKTRFEQSSLIANGALAHGSKCPDTAGPEASSTQLCELPPRLGTRTSLLKDVTAPLPVNKAQGSLAASAASKSNDLAHTFPSSTATQHTTTTPLDNSPAEAADIPSKNHGGILPDTTAIAIQARSSTALHEVSMLEKSVKNKHGSKDQSIPAATFDQSCTSLHASTPGTGHNINDVSKQAANYLESWLRTPRQSSVAPKTPVLEPTTGLPMLAISGTDHSSFVALDTEERNSEAFRLIQELTTNGEQQANGADEVIYSDENQQRAASLASAEVDGHDNPPTLRISDIESDTEPPRKRSKQNGVGAGSVGLLRRKIVLDLLDACGGACPYYGNSLWIAFITAWRKAGQTGKPDIKTLKTAVKSLCQNGSAKQIKFSHRNKKGIMVTKTILAKSDLAVSDPIILDIQKRMMDADPRQYLPEALDVDSELKQGIEREKVRPWSAVFEEQTVETSVTPAKVLRLQLRETLFNARKRQHATRSRGQDTDEASDIPNDNVLRRPRLGVLRRKYATSTEPYQKPKLAMYQHPRPHQQLLPDRLTEDLNAPQFRTEIPQLPLTFEALGPKRDHTRKSQSANAPHSSGDADSGSHSSSIRTTPQVHPVQPTTIVWKKIGDQPVLPSSMDDILLDDRRRKRPDFTKECAPNYREFEWNIDGVALWEQRSFNLFDFKSTNWVFINHSVGKSFQVAPGSESMIVFGGLVWYDNRGCEHTETRFHVVDQETPGHPTAIAQALDKRKRIDVDAAGRAKKRRGAASSHTQPQTITDSAGNLIDVSHLIGAKYKRPRGIQHLRTMPEHLIYKLTVTIVVVRALAGGLERHINWPLVMSVFPSEDEQFVKDRWKTISNKHRRDVEQLFENFQDKFPKAYANGEVPDIDFDDLQSVDWENVVKWALNSLDKPTMHEIPDLPATSWELNESTNIRVETSHRPYRDMFGYNQAVTIPMKEAAICAVPFAVPLPQSLPTNPLRPSHLVDPTDEISDSALALAKSWALSTITTPLKSFDAAKAHTKLRLLAPSVAESDALVKSAMRSITSAKAVVKKRDKGLDAKGRSFDLSRIFTDALDQRRTINAMMLKQATDYKTTVLDRAFRKSDKVRFDPIIIEDGAMIAVLNLVANGRIRIKIGDDVPRNRWGIDPESRYKTRSIRKECLYFTVLIVQVPAMYVFGNPLLEHDVPIPNLGTGERDKIPIWRDVHGGFQRKFWNLALAAVLGILATRPGANVREVAKMTHPALTAWEVECQLGWCLEVGVVKKTGDDKGGWTGGWEVREWWWMVLDCGAVDNKQALGSSST